MSDIEIKTLEEKYIDAVMEHDFEKAEAILDNSNFTPTLHCLSETIYQNNMRLTRRIMETVEPDDSCLAYAIMNQRHSLIKTILSKNIEVTPASLQYAITACNIKMVKYLLNDCNLDISTEILWDLENNAQPEDNFSPQIRLRRNRIIKSMLHKVLLEKGYTQEEIDEELIIDNDELDIE